MRSESPIPPQNGTQPLAIRQKACTLNNMPPDLSDDQITTILTEEYQRLHNVSPANSDQAKELAQMRDAVQVMKIRHAQNQAEAKKDNEILAALRAQIAWADLQLAGDEENPYLTTNSPAVLARQILESKQSPPPPVPQISVEEALERLKGKAKPSN
jgi:hypothetical protein